MAKPLWQAPERYTPASITINYPRIAGLAEDRVYQWFEATIIDKVVETEYNGRRYLWPGLRSFEVREGRFEKSVKVGAFVVATFSMSFSLSRRRSVFLVKPITLVLRVVPGATSVVKLDYKIEDELYRENVEGDLTVELGNLELIEKTDGTRVSFGAELEAEYRNAGYTVSRNRSYENLLAWYILKYILKLAEAAAPTETAEQVFAELKEKLDRMDVSEVERLVEKLKSYVEERARSSERVETV